MKTIFRELDDAFKVLLRMDESDDTKIRYKALIELQKYIDGFSWYTGSAKIRDEIEKYYKLPISHWAYKTGRSPKNCNLILKRSSDTIRECIGYDKVDKILNGTLSDVKHVGNSLVVASLYARFASEFIIEDALRRTCRYQCSNEYDISELQVELKFLSAFTKWSWEFNIGKINNDKMAYIIQVLNSTEAGYLDDKVSFLQYFAKHKDMHLLDE
ncbi:hypothetical protein Q604_UNBC18689G0003 [human gut metagenome]|uniref:Uncharacterized protein n=1 Tax=human gut metagenome TaxID=408170 RepID=W1WLN0_9ZZZZ|nr:hypothetical protein [Clostridium butyricum]